MITFLIMNNKLWKEENLFREFRKKNQNFNKNLKFLSKTMKQSIFQFKIVFKKTFAHFVTFQILLLKIIMIFFENLYVINIMQSNSCLYFERTKTKFIVNVWKISKIVCTRRELSYDLYFFVWFNWQLK